MIEQICQYLSYDPHSGVFTWIKRSGRQGLGTVAGQLNQFGYRRIQVLGKRYLASHLAFVFMLGRLPISEVDHENRSPDDNRWLNLREATSSQNGANTLGQPTRRKAAFKGVSPNHSRWMTQVGHRYIGTFDTQEEAARAYSEAAKEKFGEFARW